MLVISYIKPCINIHHQLNVSTVKRLCVKYNYSILLQNFTQNVYFICRSVGGKPYLNYTLNKITPLHKTVIQH
jgi:hypothetical protein